MSINVRYAADQAILRITGDLTPETAFGLGDELLLAAEYYRYDRITLAIDSRGGDSAATLLLLDQMRELQRQGLTIATRGLTTVASAAALLLAAGSIPHREIGTTTRLLVHSARLVIPGHAVLTREALDTQRLLLDSADHAAFSSLANHVFAHHRQFSGNAGPLDVVVLGAAGEERVLVYDHEQLARLYSDLAAIDRMITPAIARGYRLVDRITGAEP